MEAFVPNEYVAACAQYELRLMCKHENVMHGGSTEYGGNGNCTTTITEFAETEEHGGTYNSDLTINGTLLDDYKDIRDYFEDYTADTVP